MSIACAKNNSTTCTNRLDGQSDNFLLQRTRLFVNAKKGNWLRIYGEAIDATSSWEDFTPRGINENRFDALNLFADVLLHETCEGNYWGRGGRQELLYGNQRLSLAARLGQHARHLRWRPAALQGRQGLPPRTCFTPISSPSFPTTKIDEPD